MGLEDGNCLLLNAGDAGDAGGAEGAEGVEGVEGVEEPQLLNAGGGGEETRRELQPLFGNGLGKPQAFAWLTEATNRKSRPFTPAHAVPCRSVHPFVSVSQSLMPTRRTEPPAKVSYRARTLAMSAWRFGIR